VADAELTLIMKARNLASGAVNELSGSLDKVTTHGSRLSGIFAKLKTGASLMAGAFSFAFGPASALIGAILKATGADKILAAEIQKVADKLAIALAPTIRDVVAWLQRVIAKAQDWIDKNRPLIDQITTFAHGALAAFITALSRVIGFIGGVAGAITSNKPAMDFLRAVVGQIAIAFQTMTSAIQGTINKVAQLISWVRDLIGWIAKAIKALTTLNLRAGNVGHDPIGDWLFGAHAEGGWVGLRGPELAMVGERGPEYITPNHRLGDMGGGRPVEIPINIDGREIARLVDERLYFTLRRAAPTGGRV
jgi:hypothetical protein